MEEEQLSVEESEDQMQEEQDFGTLEQLIHATKSSNIIEEHDFVET